MTVAVDQPNYIPWKGYFDLIHDVDLFVFYNDVQYTTRDWRNRNKIITPHGEKWLSIPVGSNTNRKICEVEIKDSSWQRIHYETIKYAYGHAPYFRKYQEFFEDCYLGRTWNYLHEIDQYLIMMISRLFLGIKTKFTESTRYKPEGFKHERLLNLIDQIGGGGYRRMNLDRSPGIILFQKITVSGGLNCDGKIMMIIQNIRSLVNLSIIMCQYWICCLMLAMIPHISYGDGEKKREGFHIPLNNRCWNIVIASDWNER